MADSEPLSESRYSNWSFARFKAHAYKTNLWSAGQTLLSPKAREEKFMNTKIGCCKKCRKYKKDLICKNPICVCHWEKANYAQIPKMD